MSVAALITWIITAVGGAVLLGTWLSRGGLRASDTGATRFPPGLILGHFLPGGTTAAPGTGDGRPPEQHFPVAVVYLHGLLAVATVVLVLLTALGVGS